jgi:hypothetical protein
MGWDRIGYDDAGAHFRGRIKALRPTLLELYQKTRAYDAEHAELVRRVLRAGNTLALDPEAVDDDARSEYQELVGDGMALLDAANAHGQAFIMVVNPALQELKDSVGDLFELGPPVFGDIRLTQALVEVANAVRHRHKVQNLSLKALYLSAGRTKHFTGILASLGINPKDLGAAKAFIMKWAPPTYREFEDRLLAIGHAASKQFPDK